MKKLLIDALVETDATKQVFNLTMENFAGGSVPVLRSGGLGTGDTVTLFNQVAKEWVDTGLELTGTAPNLFLSSLGLYSVNASLTTTLMAFTADVINGVLDTLVVVDAGANHTDATDVTFTPTGGTGLITFNIVSGAVDSAVLTTPGTGYNNETDFVLGNGPVAPAAEAAITATYTVDIVNGVLTNLTLTEAGSNYDNDTSLTFTPTGGTGEITYDVVATAVDSPSITTAGTGYNDATAQVLTGSPAAPADEPAVDMILTADIVNGTLTNITTVEAGSNYVNASGETFTPTGGNGEITYDVVLTAVDSAAITTAGTGYNDETDFVLGNGPVSPAPVTPIDAIFIADISGGLLINVQVTEEGANYDNVVAATFVPTGGNSDAEVTYDVVARSVTNVTLTAAGTGYDNGTDVILLGGPTVAPVDAIFKVVIVGGELTQVTLTEAGFNYVDVVEDTFVPIGGNSDAEITYDVVDSSVTNVSITAAGTGYFNGTDDSIDGGPKAVLLDIQLDAAFTVDIVNGALTNLTTTEAGSNYDNGTNLTFTPTGGTGEITYDVVDRAVDSATITTAGTGYNDEEDFVLLDFPTAPAAEGSIDAIFTANVTNGILGALAVSEAGSNYEAGTDLTFGPTGGNSDALVTYDVVAGAVTNEVLTTPGTGYNDEVGFEVLGGPVPPAEEASIDAIFTVDIVNGTLTNLTVTEAGSNYDNDTSLTFTPTGGNGEITYDVVLTAVTNASITTPGTGYNDEDDFVLLGAPLPPIGPANVEIEASGRL